ncbi:aromatic alcohol reductase [Aspergillus novofumigatus IBT 16806]|uniref:Isoflavone reductase family protein n=1 Tax=Aspergillus novofumigatus (strain IBT 16806) TaxID=1392255 RepID=A0A2I1CF67_ASPN1|nr:isoflavone reductase family protein [Aspergillus novofumigatus IBT 16806]PKX96238.1 isoflavone reductase family protein [Aspergillus novofumigatus IBT 16806]
MSPKKIRFVARLALDSGGLIVRMQLAHVLAYEFFARERKDPTKSTWSPHSICTACLGELGNQVLHSLARHPHRDSATIAVLLRPSSIASTTPDKVKELEALRNLNVQLIPGDIAKDSEKCLSDVFGEYDTIIGCTGFAAGSGTQLKLACAVLAAQVPRYVPWQFGVDYDTIGRGSAQDLFDEQLDVRDLLRSQDRTKWVILSTGMFTSFLFEPWFGVVKFKDDTIVALGSLVTKVSVTAPEDIGKITAEAVLGSRADSDTLTYEHLARLVERITGRKFTRHIRTVQAARADLAKDPDNTLFKYQIVFGEGRGVAWDLSETWNCQVGIHALTAEEWARLHLQNII